MNRKVIFLLKDKKEEIKKEKWKEKGIPRNKEERKGGKEERMWTVDRVRIPLGCCIASHRWWCGSEREGGGLRKKKKGGCL